MNKKTILEMILPMFLLTILAFNVPLASAAPTWNKNPKAFIHGIALDINGETWYFAGPGSIEGATDVPGHTWVSAGSKRVKGRHYNVGPWMAPAGTPWWASEEPYGVLLFMVDGILEVPPDELTEEKEQWLKEVGYVHFHELVDMMGNENEDIVVYLKHTAVRAFYFDGGLMAPGSNHDVSPGIDYNFMPNW
ncbi:hypothetical protein E3J49_02905 [Candidatus Bathyarchaeota archaeon]|nr:MAG: hypothetical protein E3J49_02905 [Candidatus Bathyarchaeota archaeon]